VQRKKLKEKLKNKPPEEQQIGGAQLIPPTEEELRKLGKYNWKGMRAIR
jgi:hypothetical protein